MPERQRISGNRDDMLLLRDYRVIESWVVTRPLCYSCDRNLLCRPKLWRRRGLESQPSAQRTIHAKAVLRNCNGRKMENTMSEAGQATVEQGRDWARAGFSVVFFLLVGVGAAIFSVLAVIQLIWFLWKKAPNPSVQKFAVPLAQWLTDATRFVLMDTEEKPFPWAPLPTVKSVA